MHIQKKDRMNGNNIFNKKHIHRSTSKNFKNAQKCIDTSKGQRKSIKRKYKYRKNKKLQTVLCEQQICRVSTPRAVAATAQVGIFGQPREIGNRGKPRIAGVQRSRANWEETLRECSRAGSLLGARKKSGGWSVLAQARVLASTRPSSEQRSR